MPNNNIEEEKPDNSTQGYTRREMLGLASSASIAIFSAPLLTGISPSANADWALSKTPTLQADYSDKDDVSIDVSKFRRCNEEFSDYIYLAPEKLGGGTHAIDLGGGKTLAWISYWNYGDTCPISHHLAAYPSTDPFKSFEFVNSTQGGENIMIYGLDTKIKERGLLDKYGQGNHLYRVHYDGQSMNLIEDIAETTGIGLGVHVTVFPDAKGFASADGQKDICAFFDRPALTEKTQVIQAFRADWLGSEQNGSLADNWLKGGTLRLTRLIKPKDTGKYELEGSNGNKIDWEMVPMGEDLVEKGELPGGENLKKLTGFKLSQQI